MSTEITTDNKSNPLQQFVTEGGRKGTVRKCSVCSHVGEPVVKSVPYIGGNWNNYYSCSKCGAARIWSWEEDSEI